jgi:hypothetical protein
MPSLRTISIWRHDAFQVQLPTRAHLRDLLRSLREVAVFHDPDDMARAARREQQFSDVRRQRDDALRRLLQGDGIAVAVLDADRGGSRQACRQRGQEQCCFHR